MAEIHRTKMVQFRQHSSETYVFIGYFMEARVGIEPTHKGFADLSLTTWVPRLNLSSISKISQ
jgi:hypothetical protein